MMQILRQSLKLLRFTQLFDNVNPFTEAVVGDWDLPDEVIQPETHSAEERSPYVRRCFTMQCAEG